MQETSPPLSQHSGKNVSLGSPQKQRKLPVGCMIYLAGLVSGAFLMALLNNIGNSLAMMEFPAIQSAVGTERIINVSLSYTTREQSQVSQQGGQPSLRPQEENKQAADPTPNITQIEQPRPGTYQFVPLQPSELKVQTPIIVMGMMKAGTTSIYSFFRCGLDPKSSKLSHYDCRPGRNPKKIIMSCGRRMRTNLKTRRVEAFNSMDDFHLYSELDAMERFGMTLPQYSFLQQIYDNFPNATWILNTRDAQKWLHSVDRWRDLRQRFIDMHLWPHFRRGLGTKDEEMIEFYNHQAQRVRDFVKEHPSIHFVEVKIDDDGAGQVMEDATGITRQCWGNKNVNQGDAKWRPN